MDEVHRLMAALRELIGTRADSSEGSPVLVRLAGLASELEEELLLADLLGASTLIVWTASAEPGT